MGIMVDENTPLGPEFAPEPVDEGKIRRQSMWKGALRFAKNGMMVGAIGGLVLTGGMLGMAALGVKLAATGVMAGCAIPYVGWAGCALASAVGIGTAYSHIATNGLLGTGIQALFAVGSIAFPVVLGGIAIGAAVGLAWGAAHGAADAEKDIEKAEQAAKVDAHRKVVAHQRQQYEKAQLAQMQMEFAQQGHDMGLLPSPNTPGQPAREQVVEPRFSGHS